MQLDMCIHTCTYEILEKEKKKTQAVCKKTVNLVKKSSLPSAGLCHLFALDNVTAKLQVL